MERIIKQVLLPGLTTLGVVVLTAWLFFDYSKTSLLLLFYIPMSLHDKRKKQKQQRRWELNLAFKDALICLENSLAVGYSAESSIREVVKNLDQMYDGEHDICREFRWMCSSWQIFLPW